MEKEEEEVPKDPGVVLASVKILSYNFFMRWPLVKTNKSDHKNDRLKEFLATEAPKWDIIAFQELFGAFSKRRSKLIEKAKKIGFHHHHKDPAPSVFSSYLSDGGLVILSKYEMMEQHHLKFKDGALVDALATKGALHVKLKITADSPPLHLFSTHLQASYNDSKAHLLQKTLDVRRSQLKQLVEFMHEKTREDSFPILLVGDFNVDGRKSREDGSDSKEYEEMMEILNSPYFSMRDLLKEHYGVHPITSGDILNIDGEEIAKETVFTHPNDQFRCKSLDYIFWVERKGQVGKRAIFDFRLSLEADPFTSHKSEQVRAILASLSKQKTSSSSPLQRKNTIPTLEEEGEDNIYKEHPELKPIIQETLSEIEKEAAQDFQQIEKMEEKEKREEEEKKKKEKEKEEKKEKEGESSGGGGGGGDGGKRGEDGEGEKKGEYYVSVDLNSVSVEEMLREGKKFTQLSDHYGVSVQLNYKILPK